MSSVLFTIAAAIAFLMGWRQRRKSTLPALAVIVSPRQSTTISRDGAVSSVQSAELTVSERDLDRLWNPTNLENLARTYWRFLSRVTLGLIRVIYAENERRVVLLGRPLTLLRFEAPEYSVARDHGKVLSRIAGGLLVARSGRDSGFLSLAVTRASAQADGDGNAKLRIEVEVSNFYPSIAAGFSTPVYEATQSAIHVLVTHAFLRSLANLRLAESKVGRFAFPEEEATDEPDAVEQDAGTEPRAEETEPVPVQP